MNTKIEKYREELIQGAVNAGYSKKTLTLWIKLADDTSEFMKTLEQEARLEAVQDMKKAMPEKEDDRPEITEWLFSEERTKGYNTALSEVNIILNNLTK